MLSVTLQCVSRIGSPHRVTLGVRPRTRRRTRMRVMAFSSTASRASRCGFVQSGLFSTSSLHLFITFAFRFWFFAFRSKGRSAGRCCTGGLVCGLGHRHSGEQCQGFQPWECHPQSEPPYIYMYPGSVVNNPRVKIERDLK
jgi:hypothetical protein